MSNGNLHKTIFFKNEKKDFYINKPKPALFLDRDGVILKECNHLSNPNKVFLEKGIKKLTEFISSKNIPLIIITNQSGIHRGEYSWEEYEIVTERMLELLGSKVKIHAIYANSEDRNCTIFKWRKPSPEMIFLAEKEFNLDLSKSFLIGDRKSDLEAGINAKITNLVHVNTGHGKNEREMIKRDLKSTNKNPYNLKLIENLEEIVLCNLLKNFY